MIGKERMGGKRVNSGKECREEGKEEREGRYRSCGEKGGIEVVGMREV